MSLGKFAKGVYKVKNSEKYLGNRHPIYRSGWELSFMLFCDNNPSIQEWASEPLRIPYRDPLTGKQTVYVPDFLIVYVDKNLRKHVELVEIKPSKQTLRERVGKNPYDQAQYVKNMAKWESARIFCQRNNMVFRVITEHDLYVGTKK